MGREIRMKQYAFFWLFILGSIGLAIGLGTITNRVKIYNIEMEILTRLKAREHIRLNIWCEKTCASKGAEHSGQSAYDSYRYARCYCEGLNPIFKDLKIVEQDD